MKNLWLIVLLLFLNFWTIRPLLHPGFFDVHDNLQIERVYEMSQALKDNQLPVRWVKDLGYGYGYPIFNFYAPLPYYFGGLLNLLGVNLIQATKLMFVFGIIFSAVSMYFLAKEFWGKAGGLLSAVLYSYAPYHALDIYVRGAVGEFWALAFIPLIFLGITKISKYESRVGVIVGTVGLVGTILSHNLTAFMLVPFLSIYGFILFLLCKKRKYFILNTLYLILLSLLLSAFYWLPALWEMKFTNVFSQIGGGADFRKHFIDLDQLWDFPWGFGGSAGRESGISYKVGKPNIILWLIFIISFFFTKNLKPKKELALATLIGFVTAVFFTNNLSLLIWENIWPMGFIQYPWRFIIFAVFFSALAGGYLIELLRIFLPKLANYTFILIIVIIIGFHQKYFYPQRYTNNNINYYTNLSHLNWQASKISDEYLPMNFPKPKSREEIITEKIISEPPVSQKVITSKSNELSFQTNSNSYAKIKLAIANFPGWKILVDGNKIEHSSGRFLTFTISQGRHIVSAKLGNTPIQSLANLFSLLGVLLVGGILIRLKYGKSF